MYSMSRVWYSQLLERQKQEDYRLKVSLRNLIKVLKRKGTLGIELSVGVLWRQACVMCTWASHFVYNNAEVCLISWCGLVQLLGSIDRDNYLSTSGSFWINPRKAQQNPGKETRKERRPLQALGLDTARKIAWSQQHLWSLDRGSSLLKDC